MAACTRCGACCIAFDAVEIVYKDIKDKPASFFKATTGFGWKLGIQIPGLKKCPHLRGRKEKTCLIYEDRPVACRLHTPTKENCEWARAALAARKKGLTPKDKDWPISSKTPNPPSQKIRENPLNLGGETKPEFRRASQKLAKLTLDR